MPLSQLQLLPGSLGVLGSQTHHSSLCCRLRVASTCLRLCSFLFLQGLRSLDIGPAPTQCDLNLTKSAKIVFASKVTPEVPVGHEFWRDTLQPTVYVCVCV